MALINVWLSAICLGTPAMSLMEGKVLECAVKIKFASHMQVTHSSKASGKNQDFLNSDTALLAALKCARNRSPTLTKLYGASAIYLAILWLGTSLLLLILMCKA